MSDGKLNSKPADLLFDELEELDLLKDSLTGLKLQEEDLSGLSARIQKRFEEQKEAAAKEGTVSRARQLLLLNALLRTRKTLRGVTNLDLGSKVELKLICDDLQGWPRMLIVPLAKDQDLIDLPQFEVSGVERSGIAEFVARIPGSNVREELLLHREDDLSRVSRTLKRNLRLYLDKLTEEILNPRKFPEQNIQPVETKQIIEDGPALRDVNLFEEGFQEDVLEKLPQLEEIKLLEGLE